MSSLKLCLALLALSTAKAMNSGELPVVDLDYAVYQGSFHEGHHNLFNFSNIRFAKPPVGELRFGKPVAPSGRNPTIENGQIGRVCPQALAAWEVLSGKVVGQYLQGSVPVLSDEEQRRLKEPSELGLPIDPRETEDCLFLDVVTPVKTFRNAAKPDHNGGAPVIVWFYGGGYTAGDKTWHSPTGLINASYYASENGLVFVAPNNRVGAFGWLGGSKLDSGSMVANAALYDQRLALKWVQKNIHHFGGDPRKVTVMGDSAGGGSILHHLTAFGGQDDERLFQRAIPQSSGWVAIGDVETQDNVVDNFLSLANVTTLQEARELSTEALKAANRLLISNSPYGTSTCGPVVDGVYAPKLPDVLLAEGKFRRDIDLLIGSTNDEGLVFTSPNVVDDVGYMEFLEDTFSNAEPETLDCIATTLYPAIFDGSYGYYNQTQRASLTKTESEFTCRYSFMQDAYGKRARSYLYHTYPSLHEGDLAYAFYDGSKPQSHAHAGIDASTAISFQQLLTSFATTGVPSSPKLSGGFPDYSTERHMLGLVGNEFRTVSDPADASRCKFWRSGLYL